MKNCNDCGAIIKGRIDKKFCNDHCRCNYYNALNKTRYAGLKKINAILKKNLNILETFHEKGITRLSLDMLVTAGFNFSFFTHQLCGSKGECYYCCYNFGYLKITELEFAIKTLPL